MSAVLITRTTGGDTTNGKPVPHRGDGRVYITRVYATMPEAQVFSSTPDRDQAERFTRETASQLVARHWSHRSPEIEEDAG